MIPHLRLYLITLLHAASITCQSLIIKTTSGTIAGLINGTTPDVTQFLGVPFGKPPTGRLRFLPPVAAAKSDSTIDATRYPLACPQYESASKSTYSVDAREFLIGRGETGEDCLKASIWVPSFAVPGGGQSGKGLPIIVWIYGMYLSLVRSRVVVSIPWGREHDEKTDRVPGGGFQTGGTNIPYQIPSHWVQRSQKHIVISIQYRVNIFGYPNSAGINETAALNPGLLDQRLGLEWVRENAAAFGGDASRISLWGQSAGAESVDFYNFAYPSDPIVAGLIQDSGTALLPQGTQDPVRSNFSFVAHHVGCSKLNAGSELACMQKVPFETIEAFLKGYSDNATQPGLSFSPVVDNTTIFVNYTARALAGKFTKVPAILGNNANEGRSLVAYNPSGPNLTAARIVTLDVFQCPADVTARNRYAAGAETFRYFYAGNFSNIAPRPWEGAYHSSELPLIFGTSGIARGASTAFEISLSEKMQDLYLAFASDPVNGLKSQGWPTYKPGGNAIELGKDGVIVQQISISSLGAPCAGYVPSNF
jgi:acetylcholinesterase